MKNWTLSSVLLKLPLRVQAQGCLVAPFYLFFFVSESCEQ